jgi:hypothetical protein
VLFYTINMSRFTNAVKQVMGNPLNTVSVKFTVTPSDDKSTLTFSEPIVKNPSNFDLSKTLDFSQISELKAGVESSPEMVVPEMDVNQNDAVQGGPEQVVLEQQDLNDADKGGRTRKTSRRSARGKVSRRRLQSKRRIIKRR